MSFRVYDLGLTVILTHRKLGTGDGELRVLY